MCVSSALRSTRCASSLVSCRRALHINSGSGGGGAKTEAGGGATTEAGGATTEAGGRGDAALLRMPACFSAAFASRCSLSMRRAVAVLSILTSRAFCSTNGVASGGSFSRRLFMVCWPGAGIATPRPRSSQGISRNFAFAAQIIVRGAAESTGPALRQFDFYGLQGPAFGDRL